MNTNKKPNCVAFIFARGGSKGVPRKNVRNLGGLPLIAYSIQVAQVCSSISRVVVSTDDEEIAAVAREYGAEVPFIRPAGLASDASSEYDAWKHAVRFFEENIQEKIDIFVSLPATSPLRSVDDVERCIQEYLLIEVDTVVTVKEAARSPFFNMLWNDAEGFSELVNLAPDGKRYVRRQDAPQVYDMTTVAYVTSPDFILNSNSIFDGKVRSVLIPDERALDIDTLYDFKLAECLIGLKEDE